jgi:hypothetical protein
MVFFSQMKHQVYLILKEQINFKLHTNSEKKNLPNSLSGVVMTLMSNVEKDCSQLRASRLLGRSSALQPLHQPFFVLDVIELGSCKLFPRTGFEPQSTWSSASWVARIAGVRHQRLVWRNNFNNFEVVIKNLGLGVSYTWNRGGMTYFSGSNILPSLKNCIFCTFQNLIFLLQT